MINRSVLISGASIAGPALAYWLQRRGFEVTVIERASAIRPGGYAVDFRGTALEVLARMQLLDTVRGLETRTGPIRVVNRAGQKIASMPDGFTSGELEIMRGDLVSILFEATRRDVHYLFGDSIRTLTQDTHGVQVEFQHAGPRRFDLVIGADGLHSKVRALAFGPEANLLHELRYYIAIFTAPNHLGLDHAGVYYPSLGKRVGVFSARGNREATVSLYLAADSSEYTRRPAAEQQQLLREHFEDEGWELPTLLNQMEAAQDFYFDSISQVRLPHWSAGRVALLGDAAYCSSPVSGMGTSLALVGAYVLAAELQAAEGDYATAFGRFETRLRPFVTEAQKLADGVEWFVPRTRLRLWLSNRLWNILPKSFWRQVMIEQPQKIASLVSLQDDAEI